MVHLYPHKYKHETGHDGNDAQGCSHELSLDNDEVEEKCNPTKNDEDCSEEMEDKPWDDQKAFVSSDTENDHNAGEQPEKGDHNNYDKHPKRINEVSTDCIKRNDATVDKN